MDSKNQAEREKVRNQIIESFVSSSYPGDSRLLEIDPKENRDPDAKELFGKLQGTSWQEFLSYLESIDGPELYWFSAAYMMLTPEAFFYYFPAFLIVSLDLPRVDVVGCDLCFVLDAPNEWDTYRSRYVNEVMSRSTPSQKSAIQRWARYLLEEYPQYPQVGPLRYWL